MMNTPTADWQEVVRETDISGTRPVLLSLHTAQSRLRNAERALDGWCARQTTAYVSDGHAAIRFIDDLIRELHSVRAALITQIRIDEAERAARVDELLAAWRATRRLGAVDGLFDEANPVLPSQRFDASPIAARSAVRS